MITSCLLRRLASPVAALSPCPIEFGQGPFFKNEALVSMAAVWPQPQKV